MAHTVGVACQAASENAQSVFDAAYENPGMFPTADPGAHIDELPCPTVDHPRQQSERKLHRRIVLELHGALKVVQSVRRINDLAANDRPALFTSTSTPTLLEIFDQTGDTVLRTDRIVPGSRHRYTLQA